MPDLKDCPCCGSDTVRYRDERGGRSVECIYCGLGTAIYGMGVAKHEVVGKWNRRAQPEGDELLRKALWDILARIDGDLRATARDINNGLASGNDIYDDADLLEKIAEEALERGEG